MARGDSSDERGSDPVVLSLSPEEIIGPVHERLAAGMAPHCLVHCPGTDAEALATLADVDYLIGDWTHQRRLDAPILDEAIRCLAIFQPTAGVQSVDIGHAASLGIPVANAPGTNDQAVAEWTVMAILAMIKDVWRHHLGVQAGRWDMVAGGRDGVYELAGRTVGIVGFGRIGRAVARRLQGFEPGRIVYADTEPGDPEVELRLTAEQVSLDELLSISDAVTLHVPLTPSTHGLLDARRIALLPAGAVLVNVARGAVVDEGALYEALHTRRLRAAALDVFAQEPLPADHPFRRLDNVLLSPHLSGSTNEARERMAATTLRNLDRVLRGRAPDNVINNVLGVPRRSLPGFVYTT